MFSPFLKSLRTVLVWVSAILLIAGAAAMIESFWYCDEVGYYSYKPAPPTTKTFDGGRDCRVLFGSWRGGVFLLRTECEIDRVDWYRGKPTPEIIVHHWTNPRAAAKEQATVTGAEFPEPRWRWAGFNLQRHDMRLILWVTVANVLFQHDQSIVIPYWVLLVLLAIAPTMRVRRWRVTLHRRSKGLCLHCGYDLVASGKICSECGHEPLLALPSRGRRPLAAVIFAIFIAAFSLMAFSSNHHTESEPFTRLNPGTMPSKIGLPHRLELEAAPGILIRFALIPAGTFTMGSPDGERQAQEREMQHKVTITRPFYMGITMVTQEQYNAVMEVKLKTYEGPTKPAHTVSWNQADDFCHRVSNRTGRKIRLPTEAEWEYACRAGTTTPFNTGELLTADQADCYNDCIYPMNRKIRLDVYPLPVGSFPPNAWGLYDMHSRVEQWCSDRFGEYPAGDATDPTGPDDGNERVCRGSGGWGFLLDCRSAKREFYGPTWPECGFRVVMESQ